MTQYTNSELAEFADPAFDQHFLVSPEKLKLIVTAAAIRPSDAVVEIGAGVGTVARHFPQSRTLTLIELDQRLIEPLRKAVPAARIMQGNALSLLPSLRVDVLVSNLPNLATAELLTKLPHLLLRTAIVTMGERATELDIPGYESETVTTISGGDFSPHQETISKVVKFSRAQ